MSAPKLAGEMRVNRPDKSVSPSAAMSMSPASRAQYDPNDAYEPHPALKFYLWGRPAAERATKPLIALKNA